MSPKRKGKAPAAAAKKARKPDWRMPLFYWRGTVTAGTWEGLWVASEEGVPTAAEFAASTNSFKLICADGGQLEGNLTGSYKLDNGDGPADFSDLEHKVHSMPVLSKAGTKFQVVGARGDTPFGPFVSLGVLVDETTLTLARRYIDGKDPRNKLSFADVVEKHCPVIDDEPEEVLKRLQDELLPWQFDGPLERAKPPLPPAPPVTTGGAIVPQAPTNPHVALFTGKASATNPHMAFARK